MNAHAKYEALMVIDLQKGFIDKNNQQVVWQAQDLQKQYQYVYVSMFMSDDDDFNERFGRTELAFKPREDARVFHKSTHNAATPEVIADLKSRGVRDIHLCGVETNVCVLATAIALLDADFTVVVHVDACASSSTKYDWDGSRFHEAAVMIMKNMAIHTWGF